MKRGILVATLMMTAAGVASANVFTSRPSIAPPQAQPDRSIQAAAQLPAIAQAPTLEVWSKPTIKSESKSEPAPVVHKMSVDARQAPVPFQMKPRPPVNVPPADNKPADAAAKPAEPSADAAPADTAGENAARAAIEADGYKGVKVLRKGANGVWHA